MAIIVQPSPFVYVDMPVVVIKGPMWLAGEPPTVHIELDTILTRVFDEELGGEGSGQVSVVTGQIWPRKGTA